MANQLKNIVPIVIGKQLELRSLWATEKAVDQAFHLFCSPQKGRVRPDEENFLQDAKLEKVLTNGHKIQTYQWKGSGVTILLLHGWESNTYRWKTLITELQTKNFNIIAVDAPAQGYSSGRYLSVPLYVNCIQDILKKHQPEILIGHSLGGMTAIYNQYLNPATSVSKIISLGPPSELSLFMKGFQNTLRLSDSFMEKLDHYLYKKFGFYAGGFSIAEFAKNIEISGLLILEKKDKLAPYKYSKKIADNWKNCELYTVENVGHSLQSSEINTKILDFLTL
ncbi:alpha/beta fold hydrolase [Aquimarina agarivorans]|uniref:alpha/beta fold hydrolase n=1 Tax=Aquimarina agarivorans TaxID=980584 RepID=UPI000248F8D7|nr:alpha/beta hydrolase [Aquimarina agarivorans]